ncbi:26S proteasome non-atpase regulatory subunit-like isoform X1, partial [Aphis craccivora]
KVFYYTCLWLIIIIFNNNCLIMPSLIENKIVTRREILDMMNEKEKLEQQLKSLLELLQSLNIH